MSYLSCKSEEYYNNFLYSGLQYHQHKPHNKSQQLGDYQSKNSRITRLLCQNALKKWVEGVIRRREDARAIQEKRIRRLSEQRNQSERSLSKYQQIYQQMDSQVLNIINTLGWHKYDLNMKIGYIRREQSILHDNSQNMIDQISDAIRESVKAHNAEKDKFITKLQSKIQELDELIKQCRDLRSSGKSLQDDQNLSIILDQIDKGFYVQLIKRVELAKPTGEKFLDDCVQQMVNTLESTYDIVEEEYKEIKENAVSQMINILQQRGADPRDLALRQREFYQIQEWKNSVVLKGFEKDDQMKVGIPLTPVGFYCVRDGAQLYVIGGKFNNFKIFGSIMKFDLKKSGSEEIIPLKVPRYYHSATVTRELNQKGEWKSKIVIVGGQNPEMPPYDISGGGEENRLSSIKEHGDEESKLEGRKSNPDRRLTSKANSESNSLAHTFVANDKRDGPILRQCELYDPEKNYSKSIAILNFGRKKCGICSFGAVVYVISGYGERAGVSEQQVKTSYTYISTIERIDLKRYNPMDDTTWWKVVNILHEPYVDVGAFITGDQRILVFGGRDTMVEQTNVTEIKDGYFTGNEEQCEKNQRCPLEMQICFPNMASFVMNNINSTLYGLNMFGQLISHQID